MGFKFRPPRKSKYNNVKTPYNGVLYDSIKEAQFAKLLDTLRSASKLSERVVDVKAQVQYPIIVKRQKVCTYILDFLVVYADGHLEHIDVKGMKTDIYKLKKKLMKICYGIDIVER